MSISTAIPEARVLYKTSAFLQLFLIQTLTFLIKCAIISTEGADYPFPFLAFKEIPMRILVLPILLALSATAGAASAQVNHQGTTQCQIPADENFEVVILTGGNDVQVRTDSAGLGAHWTYEADKTGWVQITCWAKPLSFDFSGGAFSEIEVFVPSKASVSMK